jgi:DNA replication protein DnaC
MPLNTRNDGLTEVRTRGGELVMLLPTQIMQDLRSCALMDGIQGAQDDRYLLAELGYAGHYAEQRDRDTNELLSCWNCGGTEAFMAPTGERWGALWHVRADGKTSHFKRRMQAYPCPACQNPHQKLLEDLRRSGIADPEGAVTRDIWWKKPGREQMEAGIKELVERIKNDTYAGQVTLVGPFGSGKSTLSQYVVVQARKAHRDAIYVTAQRFKEAALEQVKNEQDGGSTYIQRIRTAPIVVMDQIDWIREITSGGQQSYTAEVFRDVFNHRYELRRTHCTVYVVNMDAWTQRGHQMLAAIYDRMQDGMVLIDNTKNTRAMLQGEAAAD